MIFKIITDARDMLDKKAFRFLQDQIIIKEIKRINLTFLSIL